MTKLDILDNFEIIKVCTHYEYKGEKIQEMSNVLNNLEEVKPIYKEFKGWNTSIEKVELFEELPPEAQTYIDYLASELEVPIQIVSIGPKRNQILNLQSL